MIDFLFEDEKVLREEIEVNAARREARERPPLFYKKGQELIDKTRRMEILNTKTLTLGLRRVASGLYRCW